MTFVYTPSLDIPSSMHFLYRHEGHRFRWCLLISHFPPFGQMYSFFLRRHLRKKPWMEREAERKEREEEKEKRLSNKKIFSVRKFYKLAESIYILFVRKMIC